MKFLTEIAEKIRRDIIINTYIKDKLNINKIQNQTEEFNEMPGHVKIMYKSRIQKTLEIKMNKRRLKAETHTIDKSH
jgi:hypothetical protein